MEGFMLAAIFALLLGAHQDKPSAPHPCCLRYLAWQGANPGGDFTYTALKVIELDLEAIAKL